MMKDLHQEQIELSNYEYCGMFPHNLHKLTSKLHSKEFQKLLKTDTLTSKGQQYIANYFKVEQQWADLVADLTRDH